MRGSTVHDISFLEDLKTGSFLVFIGLRPASKYRVSLGIDIHNTHTHTHT